MNPEDKVAVYVKDYSLIAGERLKSKKSSRSWNVIDVADGELFWRSIFCSIIDGEEWNAEDLDLIIELLNRNVWTLNQEDAYMIDEVLHSLTGNVGEEAVYPRLVYIALLGDVAKKSFIKAVIDIVCYQKTRQKVDEDVLEFLSQQTGLNWDKKLNQIFDFHFEKKEKYNVILTRIYENHKNFIGNAKKREDFSNNGIYTN